MACISLCDYDYDNDKKQDTKSVLQTLPFKCYDFNNYKHLRAITNSYLSLMPKEKYKILEMVHLFLIKMLKTMPVCLVILFYYSSNADFYAVGR
jgi:hypothetical protein